MASRTILLLALLGIICVGAPAAADVIVEEQSGYEFPALIEADGDDGAELVALGTGVRKKAWFKVYAACFYIEAGQELGDEKQAELACEGEFAKQITMHLLRDVDGEKIGGAFRDGIRKTLKEGHDEAIEAFEALFSEKVMNGDDIVLRYLPGQGLRASQAGKYLGSVKDADVIVAIWKTWFGDDPISGDLKKGLLGL